MSRVGPLGDRLGSLTSAGSPGAETGQRAENPTAPGGRGSVRPAGESRHGLSMRRDGKILTTLRLAQQFGELVLGIARSHGDG